MISLQAQLSFHMISSTDNIHTTIISSNKKHLKIMSNTLHSLKSGNPPSPVTPKEWKKIGKLITKMCCKPIKTMVELPTGGDLNVQLKPSCVAVRRCSGCCDSPLFECRPTKVIEKKFKVVAVWYCSYCHHRRHYHFYSVITIVFIDIICFQSSLCHYY